MQGRICIHFYMPGHKRTGDMGFPDPFTMDITEVDGFDNFHHPEGILKSSMTGPQAYGATRHYLVNGAAADTLSRASGQCPRGRILVKASGTATSPYHGICLNQLKASLCLSTGDRRFGDTGRDSCRRM